MGSVVAVMVSGGVEWSVVLGRGREERGGEKRYRSHWAGREEATPQRRS